MMKPNRLMIHLIVGIILLPVLCIGLGCLESKSLSQKAAKFQKEVQVVLKRLAPPLAEPVAREDSRGVQKVLVRLFSVCAEDCEGLMDNVVVLDKDGINIAVYPPEKIETWQYSDYEAVKRTIEEKKPTQAILYRQDGSNIYVICVPLIFQGKVSGILALGFEGSKVLEKRGISEEEFLSLSIQNPVYEDSLRTG